MAVLAVLVRSSELEAEMLVVRHRENFARLLMSQGSSDPYGALIVAARAVGEYRDPDARLIHVPGDVLDALIAALDALPLSRDSDRDDG